MTRTRPEHGLACCTGTSLVRSLLLPLGLVSTLLGAAVVPACATPIEGDEDEAGSAYSFEGTCDGLPKLKTLQTPPGVCVGLVANGFTFARGIAELPSGDLVLADMGGWAVDKGSVWLLRRMPDKTFSKTRIAKLIDKPSSVAVGPDGLAYVGTPNGIIRFDPYETSADPVPKAGRFRASPDYKQPRFQVVVKDLPGTGRHPLAKFVFDKADPWTIYANVGSATDVCEQGTAAPPNGYPLPCPEAEGDDAHGVIRKYVLEGEKHLPNGYTVVARGLRNSMALAVHPTSHALIQAENSRDTINKHDRSMTDNEGEFPHEELNVIVPGAHYGWPYCYDNGAANPEYLGRVDCSNYTTPALLLPAHAAPLGMTYYSGSMFPEAYRGNLLVTYHGYRAYGHRLALVPVDEHGIPGSATPMDIIHGWEKSANGQEPLGTPVDVAVASDGSIFVTEDKNGDVLRVFFDPSRGDGAPMEPPVIFQPKGSPEELARCVQLAQRTDSFSVVQREVLDAECVGCHGVGPGYAGGLRLDRCDSVGNAKRLLAARTGGREPYVVPKKVDSELVLRLQGKGFPQMPAGGVSPEHLQTVLTWIVAGAPVPQ